MDYITSFHGILECLKTKPPQAKLLIAAGEGSQKIGPRVKDILETAKKLGIPVERTDPGMLARIDPDNKGIALLVTGREPERSNSLDDFLAKVTQSALVLILDHIEDPQNLGAIIRSADAFGVGIVVLPQRRASPMGDAAMRTSAGAAAWVPVAVVQNLADAVRKLKDAGFWIYAADMTGERLDAVKFPAKTCFILGNEGEGVSRLLTERSDGTVSIPMQGHVDSLNVSVAAALCMYEYRRSR